MKLATKKWNVTWTKMDGKGGVDYASDVVELGPASTADDAMNAIMRRPDFNGSFPEIGFMSAVAA